MTFLSKIGSLILKGISLWFGFAPVVGQQLPGGAGIVQRITKDLAEIANVIIAVEAVGQLKGMPGPEKAKAAGPLVAQIVLQSTILAGKKIAKPDLFNAGCVNIAGGVADVLNSLHEGGAATVDASDHHVPVQ